MQELIGSNPKIYVANQDIPLHTFRMGIKTTYENIPFEYLKL